MANTTEEQAPAPPASRTLPSASDVTDTHIIPKLFVASSTKDSVRVKWQLNVANDVSTDTGQSPWQHMIDGYDVSYQADESQVIQYSHRLHKRRTEYNIKQLHEDTSYRVCLRVYSSTPLRVRHPCITASTKNGSLHVALGSTAGAFLALAIIIGFVLLAKWQYVRQRRRRKRKQRHARDVEEVKDSLMEGDGAAGAWRESDVPMSELSLKVNESQGQAQLDELNLDLEREASHIHETQEGNTGSCQYLSPLPLTPLSTAALSDEACYTREADVISSLSRGSRMSREKSVDSGRSLGRLSRQPSQGSCSCGSPSTRRSTASM